MKNKEIIEKVLKEEGYDNLIKKTGDEVSLRFLSKVTKIIYKTLEKAIKHIKKLQRENQTLEGINKTWNNGKINWIKSFFNIKDEDLL